MEKSRHTNMKKYLIGDIRAIKIQRQMFMNYFFISPNKWGEIGV